MINFLKIGERSLIEQEGCQVDFAFSKFYELKQQINRNHPKGTFYYKVGEYRVCVYGWSVEISCVDSTNPKNYINVKKMELPEFYRLVPDQEIAVHEAINRVLSSV